MRVVIKRFADIQSRVVQPLQLVVWISREVRLNADQSRVVVVSETVHLVDVLFFACGHQQHRILHPARVVNDVRRESVRAVTRRITADDVRISLSRMSVNADQRIAVIVHPFDVVDADVVFRVYKITARHRLRYRLQPFGYGLCREYRPTENAPFSEAVDHVVILVCLAEVLQRFDVLLRQEPVILVGRSVCCRTRIRTVKESFLQPMRDRDRIEGDNDLMVVRTLVTQTDVELVEVKLGDLRCFFDPDHRDSVNRFQLFNVIKSRKDDLRSVSESDAHRILRNARKRSSVILVCLRLQLTKARLLQRFRRFSYNEDTVSRLCCASLQNLASGKDGLARTTAAAHDKESRLAEQKRQERVVIRLAKPRPPFNDRLICLALCPLFAQGTSPPSSLISSSLRNASSFSSGVSVSEMSAVV